MRVPRPLTAGVVLYLAAAWADARMTLAGMDGKVGLEGSPVMRAMMERFGPAGGLFAEKAAVGVLCFALAHYGVREMKRRAPWLDRIPSTRLAREWVRSGDRSWVAYAPLYGAALGQALAAASWLLLR